MENIIEDKIKISVLITAYNIENYIGGAIESVLMQKGDFQLEILVGDDGSADSTVDIIKKYADLNPGIVSLYEMPREKGVNYNRVERSSANRINLLEHATGKYVCFLDGDDFYIDSNKFAKQLEILEKNEKISICTHNVVMYYLEDTPLSGDSNEALLNGQKLSRAKKEHLWNLNNYWSLEFIQANAMLFRNVYHKGTSTFLTPLKTMLEEVPMLKNNFDDNNITISFFLYGNMYYLPEIMGAYRQLENSSWNGIDELKKHCSNIIGLSIETHLCNLYMQNKDSIKAMYSRHSKDLNYIDEHKSELSKDNCQPFYDTAEKYNIDFALSIYQVNDNKRYSALAEIARRAKKYYAKAKLKRVMKKLVGIY